MVGGWSRPRGRRLALLLAIALPGCLAESRLPPPEPKGSVNFSRQVRPILSENCFGCHGPDAVTRQANVRFDTKEGALEGEFGGKRLVVPGNPAASLLYQKITEADPLRRMPPPQANKTLSQDEIDILAKWIAEGAPWADHWSFIAPVRPAVPSMGGGWAKNAVDAFVLARLEEVGASPAPEADKATLIRRITLDLTGIQPTPEEADAFLADGSADAYDKLVDRLMASPRFGEALARDWLDAARYADSNGYHIDQERFMWPWRDWVIGAFNSGKPYYQFLVEQVAGDLLPQATDDQKLASGFNRNHEITVEGGVIDEQFRAEYVADRVRTLGTAMLGVTIGCARCHDHKYDPFTQRDFYGLADCFNQIPEVGLGSDNDFAPTMKARSPILRREVAAIDARLAELKGMLDTDRARAEEAAWEDTIRGSGAAGWTTLMPISASAQSPAQVAILEDGSISVSGDTPDVDTYEVSFTFSSASPVRALRLEVIASDGTDGLAGAGPSGRGDEGVFGVTEVDAWLEGGKTRTAIAWLDAGADDEAGGNEATRAIDGLGRTSWTTSQHGGSHALILVPTTPFGAPDVGSSTLRIRIDQEQGDRATLARFRLSQSSHPLAGFSGRALAVLDQAPDARSEDDKTALTDAFLLQLEGGDLGRMRREMLALERRRDEAQLAPDVMVMSDTGPKDTFILLRGQYDAHGDKVGCTVPPVLGKIPGGFTANRAGIAQWLVSPLHPLTARVAVNRIWQLYFANGLVRTPDDFGSQGAFPTHPDLLDWLAVEFIDSGWDLKHIIRLMVTSAAYRQSSVATPDLLDRDPENRWLARGPHGRLAAEIIRDQALYAAGLLVEKLGGPGVFPYQPPGLWEALNDNNGSFLHYRTDHGQRLYRRSLYTFWKRSLPAPPMAILDASSRETSIVERTPTNTPLQSLVLLNETEFVEAARKLAERMIAEGGPSDAGRIERGYRLLLVRKPDPEESALLVGVYREQLAEFKHDKAAALRFLSAGDSGRDSGASLEEHAAMTLVARVLLNLTESVTKE